MKRTISLYFLFTCIGFTLCYLLINYLNPGTAVKVIYPDIKKQEQLVEDYTQSYKADIARLEYRDDSLSAVITQGNKALQTARAKYKYLEKKVTTLKYHKAHTDDPVEQLVICDSLEDELDHVLNVAKANDSLCLEHVSQLNDQLEVKDTIIDRIATHANNLSGSLDSCFETSKQLENALMVANDKAINRKRKHKIIVAALLVVSGVIAASVAHK